MHRAVPWSVVVVVATVAAYGAGRASSGTPAVVPPAVAPPMTATRAGSPDLRPAMRASVDPELRDAIRDVVRGELKAALAEHDAVLVQHAQAAAAAADEPDPGGDERAAVARGHALVDAASASGRWTRNDVDALSDAMVRMTRAERDEILSTLIPSINRGEIKPDFAGPLF
jgi:hypothetical protein